MAISPGADPSQDWIGYWLEYKIRDYSVDRVVEGTYGRMWILRSTSPNVIPRAIAAKSFRITQKLPAGLNLRELFEREIALWMRVPSHFNVLSALGVELVPAPDEHDQVGRIPVVRMPLFRGSLRDWINSADKQNEPNCLIAVAQLCNGLDWLYSHGVSGRGDLKPENVLFDDLRTKFQLPDSEGSVPSQVYPWRVVVADLGWANAWNELGLNDRAWRPYLAPERINSEFDPQKSDSFAVGVILTELFTGFHPAGGPTSRIAKWQRKEWFHWAEKGTRQLAEVEDPALRSLLDRCLHPLPSERPVPAEIVSEISAHVSNRFDLSLGEWIRALNQNALSEEHLHSGWANEQIASVSARLRGQALDDLHQRLKRLHSVGTQEARIEEIWIVRSLTRLLSEGDKPSEWQQASELALAACQRIIDGFHETDWSGALIYVPKDMPPLEITLCVLNELFRLLKIIAGDLPELIAMRKQVQKLIAECEEG